MGLRRQEHTQPSEKEMAVSNPRFPHHCRILRRRTQTPLIDEDGFSPLDDEVSDETGDLYTNDYNNDFDDTALQIVYEGECRSYEKHTTSDRGDVITSFRGLSLPLTQDDWTQLGFVPEEGDEIVVDRGSHREYGRVVDKNPANFHGTHLTWRYGRN